MPEYTGVASPEPLLSRGFVLLSVADLAYFTAVGVAVYTLPLYVTGPLGGSDRQAGIAFGAFAIAALLLRPLAGRLCDTVGRRPLLVGGSLLAFMGLSLTATADSLASVIGLRLLLGVGEAAFFVASLAALIDIVPAGRMGEATSYNSLGLYLGLALGPPLGEVLVENLGYDEAWWGAGLLAAAGALVVLLLGETGTRTRPAGPPAAMIHRPAVPAAVAFFTSLVAVGGFLAFAALQAEDLGIENSSLPLLCYGLLVVLLRLTLARYMDRHPPLVLGAGALTTIAAGLTVVALWAEPAGMYLGTALLALGVTVSTPAFFTAIFATATTRDRGAASGTASIFLDLGLGGGPILLGLVAGAASLRTAFATAAIVALLGALWALRVRQVRNVVAL
ncbi:MAG: MFS transporter [Nocardioidaceae bacterium]|nr:MFS transporter [Nocardioidaceae bacterium]